MNLAAALQATVYRLRCRLRTPDSTDQQSPPIRQALRRAIASRQLTNRVLQIIQTYIVMGDRVAIGFYLCKMWDISKEPNKQVNTDRTFRLRN